MKYLDLSLPTPEANLACDEALLDWCESGHEDQILRCWESTHPFAVVGYANLAAREVDLAACQARQVPVLRRCTGGGTVLQGPGCLNYALILRIQTENPLSTIPGTNQFVMEKHRLLFQRLLHRDVQVRGHTDLTTDERKFSGNAQRRRREFLLFHGSFLLNYDLALVEQLLPLPSKQPPYRQGRRHTEFLVNLGLNSRVIRENLREIWAAQDKPTGVPWERIDQLVQDKYSSQEWNLRF